LGGRYRFAGSSVMRLNGCGGMLKVDDACTLIGEKRR
jgi:hypothetical protein